MITFVLFGYEFWIFKKKKIDAYYNELGKFGYKNVFNQLYRISVDPKTLYFKYSDRLGFKDSDD